MACIMWHGFQLLQGGLRDRAGSRRGVYGHEHLKPSTRKSGIHCAGGYQPGGLGGRQRQHCLSWFRGAGAENVSQEDLSQVDWAVNNASIAYCECVALALNAFMMKVDLSRVTWAANTTSIACRSFAALAQKLCLKPAGGSQPSGLGGQHRIDCHHRCGRLRPRVDCQLERGAMLFAYLGSAAVVLALYLFGLAALALHPDADFGAALSGSGKRISL